MNLEKYDKFIWRLNGSLILVACLIGIVGGILILTAFYREVVRDRNVQQVVNLDKETKREETFRLNYLRKLENTDFWTSSLTSSEKITRRSYSKSSTYNIRNYLLYNEKTKKQRWVFPTRDQLIVNDTKIYLGQGKSQKVIGFVLEFINADTNSDNRMTSKDKLTLTFYSLKDFTMKPILEGLDQVFNVMQTSDTEFFVFYEKNKKHFFLHYDHVVSKKSAPEIIEIPDAS